MMVVDEKVIEQSLKKERIKKQSLKAVGKVANKNATSCGNQRRVSHRIIVSSHGIHFIQLSASFPKLRSLVLTT